jgi:hypothetical protein
VSVVQGLHFKFSAVDLVFEPRSDQTKDCKISSCGTVALMVLTRSANNQKTGQWPKGLLFHSHKMNICCFSATHAALGRKNRIMCPSRATCLPVDCFTVIYHYKVQIGLEQSGHHHLIECYLFSSWYYGSAYVELVLN